MIVVLVNINDEVECKVTRTAGAYGPIVLAPAEGMGAPCQFFFFFFLLFFLFFLLFLLFWFFFTFLLFTTYFTTHFTTNFTTNHYQYCHPPPQLFLYLRETQANVLRGHSPPQKSLRKQKSSQATISEQEQE